MALVVRKFTVTEKPHTHFIQLEFGKLGVIQRQPVDAMISSERWVGPTPRKYRRVDCHPSRWEDMWSSLETFSRPTRPWNTQPHSHIRQVSGITGLKLTQISGNRSLTTN